ADDRAGNKDISQTDASCGRRERRTQVARTSRRIVGRDKGTACRKAITRCLTGLAMLLCVGGAGTARAQCTNTPLPAAGIGPVNPATRYPRDSVGPPGPPPGPWFA